MKKKKDTSHQHFSHALNVRKHRTKKDIAVIDGVLMIQDGYRIRGKKSFGQCKHPPINFKLEISEEDLHRLFSYTCNSESDLGEQFSLILADAVRQAQKGARGKHKGRETAVFHIKLEAGLLYLLFSELCGNPLKLCPPFFQKLIDRIADYKAFIEDSGQPYPVMLTAYCLEEYYDKKHLASLGLNPFFSDGFSHFFYTYIKPQLAMCENMFSRMLVYKGVNHLNKRASTDFTESEFRVQEKESVQLCQSLYKAGYQYENATKNCINWLNGILQVGDLFEMITAKNANLTVTEEIAKLKKQTDEMRSRLFNDLSYADQYAIKRLNRLMIEQAYPQETPKSQHSQVFAYNPFLAARDDMVPCDINGKKLNPIPKKELSEETFNNPPCVDIFKALGLI